MTKFLLKEATHLLAMSKETLDWGLKTGEREKTIYDKIFYLGAKKLKEIKEIKRLSFLKNIVKNKFVVVFIGAFNEISNPIILTEVAKRLSHLKIHFILGGDGTSFPQVKKASENLKNVTLTGWLSEEEISYLLSFSHLGVVPTSWKIEAFPNKVFTYFSGGLPIISSVEGGLKELIKKYNIGLYYPPNDLDLLVECIKKLYEDRSLYEKMSRNAKEIFNKFLEAEKIYNEYAEYVEEIALKYRNYH
jgi:glycosyltransferase involved in cell wall biosynthesis